MDRITIGQDGFVCSDDLVNIGTDIIARTGSDPLAQLASRINAAHEAVEACFTRGVAHAVEAGQSLLDAKELVDQLLGYGHWEEWKRRHLKCSNRAARLYMQMARLPEADRQRVAELSLRRAVKALAKKTKRGRWTAEGDGSPLPPELRVGDFREVLGDIPDDSVDLIFTDPPYPEIRLYGDLAKDAVASSSPAARCSLMSGIAGCRKCSR